MVHVVNLLNTFQLEILFLLYLHCVSFLKKQQLLHSNIVYLILYILVQIINFILIECWLRSFGSWWLNFVRLVEEDFLVLNSLFLFISFRFLHFYILLLVCILYFFYMFLHISFSFSFVIDQFIC